MDKTVAQADPLSVYEEKKRRLSDQMRQSRGVRLAKKTSNLFRKREKGGEQPLSARDFNRVLRVNAEEGWADVEGMTTYEDFADATLQFGFMPAVVPQLKTITIGGAVAGVGIEATSFRYGLVHETVLEMEILLPSGATVICNKNEHADLFYGFPNSYGTLGYALRLKVKLIPVKPFVKIQHARYGDARSYFEALQAACNSSVDFVDGALFDAAEMYLTTGTFVDEAPEVSDYTYLDIYYKSLQKRKVDYLSVRDFIWRWDTDWFWCSRAFGVEHPLVRRLLGKKNLNSAVYWKMRNFAEHHPFIPALAAGFSRRESVIQDVDIPIENAPKFAEFFFKEIGIKPVWICPIGSYDPAAHFALYPLDPKKIYVNFGFWSTVPTDKAEGHYNRLVEAKVSELQGKKGLYSDSYYTEEEFWRIYDKKAYETLKQKYDPEHKLKTLYEKCVQRA